MTTLSQLLQRLCDAEIDFVIVGGFAVRNLYLRTDLGPVDFLSSITGIGDYERVRANAVEVELYGRRCHMMSLDDLILAKEAIGRDKDMRAVVELRAIREKLKKT